MSLVALTLIAGGASLGLWLGHRVRRRLTRKHAEPAQPSKDPSHAGGLELGVGDVVSVQGEELWLEHGWLLSEAGRSLAGLFQAREASLLEFAPPRREHFRLTRTDVAIPGDAPTSLEHHGVRYERVRRLPVEVSAIGDSRPPPWSTALLVEYRSLASELLLVVGQAPEYLAWQGLPLLDGALERWGSAS